MKNILLIGTLIFVFFAGQYMEAKKHPQIIQTNIGEFLLKGKNIYHVNLMEAIYQDYPTTKSNFRN